MSAISRFLTEGKGTVEMGIRIEMMGLMEHRMRWTKKKP
jgi:hypothetical protein